MSRVRLLTDHGTFTAGDIPDYDDVSAGNLVGAGIAEYADPDVFDPSEHTVPEVTEHLSAADEDERNRVLSAEANGKNRAGIVGSD